LAEPPWHKLSDILNLQELRYEKDKSNQIKSRTHSPLPPQTKNVLFTTLRKLICFGAGASVSSFDVNSYVSISITFSLHEMFARLFHQQNSEKKWRQSKISCFEKPTDFGY